MHLVHPPNILHNSVFDFPCDNCNAKENWEQRLCKIFFFFGGWGGGEGVNKVHYGLCENGE